MRHGSIYYLTAVLPYLIFMLLILICGWKKTLPYILLIVAILTTIDSATSSDLSGAFFFCLSVYMLKNNIYNIIVINIATISLAVRSVILDMSPSRIIIAVLGFFAMFALFYYIIYKENIKKQSKVKTLAEDENQLLTYLTYEDITQKEAGALMEHKSANITNDMLKRVRLKLGVTTVYSAIRLVAEYNKSKSRKDNSQK